MPESTNDTPVGMKTADVTTPTISTVSGQPEITAVRVSLINPTVTGTGTVTWNASINPDNMGAMTIGPLDQNTPFHDFPLAQPATSVTGGYSFMLGCGGTCMAGVNDASVFGVKINVMLAPEPSAGASQVAALALLAGLTLRRRAAGGGTS